MSSKTLLIVLFIYKLMLHNIKWLFHAGVDFRATFYFHSIVNYAMINQQVAVYSRFSVHLYTNMAKKLIILCNSDDMIILVIHIIVS